MLDVAAIGTEQLRQTDCRVVDGKSHPLPISYSANVTRGLSRKSSVPLLDERLMKLMRRLLGRLAFPVTGFKCSRLDCIILASIGISTLWIFAGCRATRETLNHDSVHTTLRETALMAFVLSFPRENLLANQQADSRDAALLRVCSEGRDPFEFSTPNVRLVVDRVAHDCRLLHMQSSGQKEILSVCFGWCGLVDGEGADFDDKTLAYVHAELRANPHSPPECE